MVADSRKWITSRKKLVSPKVFVFKARKNEKPHHLQQTKQQNQKQSNTAAATTTMSKTARKEKEKEKVAEVAEEAASGPLPLSKLEVSIPFFFFFFSSPLVVCSDPSSSLGNHRNMESLRQTSRSSLREASTPSSPSLSPPESHCAP